MKKSKPYMIYLKDHYNCEDYVFNNTKGINFKSDDNISHWALETLGKRTDLSLEQSTHIENKKSNLTKKS